MTGDGGKFKQKNDTWRGCLPTLINTFLATRLQTKLPLMAESASSPPRIIHFCRGGRSADTRDGGRRGENAYNSGSNPMARGYVAAPTQIFRALQITRQPLRETGIPGNSQSRTGVRLEDSCP